MRREAALVVTCLAVLVLPVMAQGLVNLTEDFETQPLDGWELLDAAGVAMAGRSSALVFSGPGVAFTPATCGQSFTLTFRLRLQNGTASVPFCISGAEGQPQQYQLRLNEEEGALFRQAARAEQALGAGETGLAGKPWVKLTITRTGGQFQVTIDDQPFITGQDANPLPAGGLAFVCHEGSGVAFDDIVLSGGAGQVVHPAIPINIPGHVRPGREPEGGAQQAVVDPGALTRLRRPPAAPSGLIQALGAPVQRGALVQSLAADPNGLAAVRAIPSLQNVQLNQLANVGLDGAPVQGAAMSVTQLPGGPGAPQPPGGLQPAASAADLNWKAGIKFTPGVVGPYYAVGGKSFAAGAWEARGLFLPVGASLSDMAQQGVLYMIGPPGAQYRASRATLHLEVPPTPADYMVAVQVAYYDPKTAAWLALSGQDPTKQLRVQCWDGTGEGQGTLSPLLSASGLATVFHINPAPSGQAPSGSGMAKSSCELTLWVDTSYDGLAQPYLGTGGAFVFGGFTVTKL